MFVPGLSLVDHKLFQPPSHLAIQTQTSYSAVSPNKYHQQKIPLRLGLITRARNSKKSKIELMFWIDRDRRNKMCSHFQSFYRWDVIWILLKRWLFQINRCFKEWILGLPNIYFLGCVFALVFQITLLNIGLSGPPKKYHLLRFRPLEVPKTSSKGIWRINVVTPTPIDLVKWGRVWGWKFILLIRAP